MKTQFSTLLTTLSIINLLAADLEVKPSGTYTTISAAISAANDGDRIIIQPKNIAYVENVTIDKSLEFLSSFDTVRYKIQGNITYSGNGKIATIQNMEIWGNIEGSQNSTTHSKLTLVNCKLEGSTGTFNNFHHLNFYSNELINIQFTASSINIIGNNITSNKTPLIVETTADDTINFSSNKILLSGEYGRALALDENQNHLIIFRNNLIKLEEELFYTKKSKCDIMLINNTMIYENSKTSYLFYEASSCLGCNDYTKIRMINNIFTEKSGSFHLEQSDYQTNSIINFMTVKNNYSFNCSDYGRAIPSSSNLTAPNGQLVIGSIAKDGADHSFEYYDLDLTRGDAGCYGSSYSLDNYFPMTGSAQVIDVNIPMGILQGDSVKIEAIGFER